MEGIKFKKPVTRRPVRSMQPSLMLFVLIFSFTSTLSLSGSSNENFVGKIVYPWNSTTAIVKAGEPFDVWFIAKPSQKVYSAVLNGPYNTVHIDSGSITTLAGSWQYDPVSENRYNRQISVTVPPDTPEERYDLILNTSEGEAISCRSVKVIREYKTNYKIFLISDSHYGQRGTEVMVPNKHTAFVEIANIINPDIVVNGGDVVYYRSDSSLLQERMDKFYQGNEAEGLKGMYDFNAATFVVAGNHDYQEGGIDGLPKQGYNDLKSDYWNRYHGLQYHFFKYGNSRFMILNNGWLGYDWQWQTDLAANWLNGKGSNGKLRVAIAHISRTESMDSMAHDNDIGLYLLGHNHHLGDRNPYMLDDRLVMYYVRAVREYLEFMLFQVDDSNGTFVPLGYTNTNAETDGYGLSTANNRGLENDGERNNPDRSVWKYKLTLDYKHGNNGNFSNNTATLVNKFDYTIRDARVRFIMPKGVSYKVSEGNIYQAFDGNDYHIVDVDIDLAADNTTIVGITPDYN
ncbi:MAG: metallophosphoesterase [Bacteroidales bacterium]